MKEITRKSMLYKTGVEYGDFTMNHVLGCSHACKFPCYAFLQKKRFGVVKTYEDWCEPAIVSNILELLEREIPRLKAKINSVHLCFSTDPFMFNHDEVTAMSLAAIRKLNGAGIKCRVLTKGILPAELANLSPANEYGITLVSLDENFRRQYEPGTADYQSRIAALRYLHNAGCRTWVSIEPYPTPNIVKQNYNPRVKAYADYRLWYAAAADAVEEYCEEAGIDCHIKKGTRNDADASD